GPAMELRVDAWKTPSGTETTGGVALILPLGGWSVRGFLGRTEPDPLTLAEPGGGAGGILLGRRIVGRDPLPPLRPPLHQVLEFNDTAALVEIHVEASRGTAQVEVIGDFTLWEAVSMKGDGNLWTIQLEIPEGIHHFGFLVDGEWFLPESAPDAVADEWGRKNATMVIER
ncbi:MAG: glycogen-binding domain-containing protein, partial [Longimicrobiales bacterium]|nr:glycogen-binding domain-containing protein [Longimicrobiales bacterium]